MLRRHRWKNRSCGACAIRRSKVAQHHRPSLFLPNNGASVGRQRRRSLKLTRIAIRITLRPGRDVIMAWVSFTLLGRNHRSCQQDVATRTRWTGQQQVRAPQWRRLGNGVTVCVAPQWRLRSGGAWSSKSLALSAFRQRLVIRDLIHRSDPSTHRLTRRTRSI